MTRRTKGLLASAAVVVAGLATWAGSGASNLGGSISERGLATPEVAAVAGPSARIYAVDYDSRDRVTLTEGSAFEGVMRIDADLRVEDAGTVDGHDLVALSFARVREASLSVAGGDLAEPSTEGRLLAELAEDGAVVAFRTDEAEPTPTTHLLRALALELGPALSTHPRGEGWSTRETTPRGVARARYAATEAGFTRAERSYERLDALEGATAAPGAFDWTVDAEGDAATIDGRETIQHDAPRAIPGRVRSAELRMRLRARLVERTDAGPRPALASLFRTDASPARASREALAAAHARLAAEGLTADQMIDALAVHGAGGRVPDHSRFLFRAVGLLRSQPESARLLAPLFEDAGATPEGRALITDLLANASTPESQEVLRALLSGEAAAADPEVNRYLTSVVLLRDPAAETVDLVEARFEGATGEDRVASAYGLGAMARRLGDRGDPRASEVTGRLRDALEDADGEDAEAVASLVTALGATARAENEPVLSRHARSDDAEVRRASARALGRLDDDASRGTLRALATDASPEVAREAIEGLAARAPDPAEAETLAGAVAAGELAASTYPALLGLARRVSEGDPAAARRLVEAMLAQGIRDPSLRTRAHDFLQRLAA